MRDLGIPDFPNSNFWSDQISFPETSIIYTPPLFQVVLVEKSIAILGITKLGRFPGSIKLNL